MGYCGKYWFYIEPYVYMELRDNRVLFFNTLDSKIFILRDRLILELLSELNSNLKRGGIWIDLDVMNNKVYMNFFNFIMDNYLGDLLPYRENFIPPFIFSAIPKIRLDYRYTKDLLLYEDVMGSLLTLNLHITSSCNANCNACKEYYRQMNSCTIRDGDPKNMDISLVRKLLLENRFVNLSRINILGGNISCYCYLDELLKLLEPYRDRCYAYYNIHNIDSMGEKLVEFFSDRICVIIDLHLFDKIPNLELLKNRGYNIVFLVKNMFDIERIERLIPLNELTIMPFYSKDNLDFFKEYVFWNESDLLSMNHTFTSIHRNQFLNDSFFGEISVFPSGDVLVADGISCGNLNSLSIYDILSDLLLKEDSLWFLTRSKTDCNGCVFVNLCPSISKYELRIGQNNLCNKIDLQ